MASMYLELIELTDDERSTLERWSRRPKSSQVLALRCRIVSGVRRRPEQHRGGPIAWE